MSYIAECEAHECNAASTHSFQCNCGETRYVCQNHKKYSMCLQKRCKDYSRCVNCHLRKRNFEHLGRRSVQVWSPGFVVALEACATCVLSRLRRDEGWNEAVHKKAYENYGEDCGICLQKGTSQELTELASRGIYSWKFAWRRSRVRQKIVICPSCIQKEFEDHFEVISN